MKLKDFLERLLQELEKNADFRKELEREPKNFVFSKRTLLTQTLLQISKGHNMRFSGAEKNEIKKAISASNLLTN